MTFCKGFEMTITAESIIKEERMKYVLFLIAILFSNQAVALNCERQPTCEELNYSKEDNPKCDKNGYILCPYDQSYKKCVQYNCESLGFTQSEKSDWCADIITCPQNSVYTACNCLKSRCNIGDVFYADGSCGDVKDYTEDKIPVGVVYDTNCAGGGKVINLKDLGSFQWGSDGVDIQDLTNLPCSAFEGSRTEDRNDPFWSAGQENTEIICKAQDHNSQYAAPAAKAFYPREGLQNDLLVGAGKWYLPTLGELMDLYGYNYQSLGDCETSVGGNGNNKQAVNNTLNSLESKGVDAQPFTNAYYWSSSEYATNHAWGLHIDSGGRNDELKNKPHHIRVSLEF